MLRYYDNLNKDYYRENGINQQLDMKKNGKTAPWRKDIHPS